MKYLVIGHSWVARLPNYKKFLPYGGQFVGIGGATFRKAVFMLDTYARIPDVQRQHPYLVVVVLGGNEISNATSHSEVDFLTAHCEDFCAEVRRRFPEAKIAVCQIEDRFDPSTRLVLADHKRFGNRFNNWLNKWKGKDALVTIKGKGVLSDPTVYCQDGVHLNRAGYVRFCSRLSHTINKVWILGYAE